MVLYFLLGVVGLVIFTYQDTSIKCIYSFTNIMTVLIGLNFDRLNKME